MPVPKKLILLYEFNLFHMKKNILTLLTALCLVIGANAQTKPTKNIVGNITSNQTWYNDTNYILSGLIYITNNATLNIQPGTVVKGGTAPDGSKATALVVAKDGILNAIGTKENPIVFTSNEKAGDRDYGDWGGIVFFGLAPSNKATPKYEGGVVPSYPNDPDAFFGGNQPEHNQGTLKYVRIEFAGYPFEQDRELNSLTMCGVGSGTTISYVQNSYNFDDAFEWFGGMVNCDHLIAFLTNDDDWDVDQGFSGKVQFGVSLADTGVADISTKNGFEVDNDGTGSDDNPRTSAIFSNITTIGAYHTKTDTRSNLHGRAHHLRRNSQISIFNSISMGWKEGLRMDAVNTFSNYQSGNAVLANNIFAGHIDNYNGAASVVTADVQAYVEDAARSNRVLAENSDVMLMNPFSRTAPSWMPRSGSPALSGASFANPKLSAGFTQTTFVGAFGTDNWTEGWTEFDPVNADYETKKPSSVAKIANISNTEIYPNPATGELNINFDVLTNETVTVKVFNSNGQAVKVISNIANGIGSYKNTINVADLTNGIYFIAIQGETSNTVFKVVINK